MGVVSTAIPPFLRLHRFCAALLGGVLLGLAFAPLGWWWLTFVAFVPLMAVQPPRSFWGRLCTGAIFGYGYFAVSLHWLNTVGFGAGWLLAGYCAMFPALWYCIFSGMITCRLPEQKVFSRFLPWCRMTVPGRLWTIVGSAAAWVALEWVRAWFLTGFPWNQLGVAFAPQPQLRMLASLAGTYGLSFIVLLVNGILAGLAAQEDTASGKSPVKRNVFITLAVAGLVLAAAFASGEWLRRSCLKHHDGSRRETLRVAAIQGNLPMNRFWDDDVFNKSWHTYSTLTRAAMAGCADAPDIYMWPEGAMPSVIVYDEYSRRLRSLLGALNAPLLLGALDERIDGDASQTAGRMVTNTFNSVFLLERTSPVLYNPLAERTDCYDKIHLVPFGEYVPLRKIFPWLVEMISMGRDLTAGQNYRLFSLGGAKNVAAGVNICFEDVFPEISRRFTLDGAEVLMTVTDDCWYGTSAGAAQHRNHAVMRAVENSRYLMRSGNNSDTCLITPTGEITGVIMNEEDGSPFTAGWRCYTIPVRGEKPQLTCYTRTGNLFAVFTALLTCAVLAEQHVTLLRHLKKMMTAAKR